MLLGEDRGRHQHQHLLAVVRRLERRPQRDLGLAVSHVTADQPVHQRHLHVLLDRFDRLALVGGLSEGEALLEFPLPVGVHLERVPGAPAPLGVQAQQLTRELLCGAARSRLHRLPARASELRQRRVLAARSHVARDLRELVGGHEHPVVPLVFQVEVVARDLRHGARLETGEPCDAMVLVHDDVPGSQLGKRAKHPARATGAAAPDAAAVTVVLGAPGTPAAQ